MIAELAAVVGSEHVRTDVPASALDDPTGLYVGRAAALVRPGSTSELQQVVVLARRHRQALVVRGGGTGLVGGSVATADEVVLDTSRLTGITVDPLERTVTAGAGCTVAAVQEALRPHGLRLPLELGSWQSATVGGIVATNAGGTQVLRHGHVRQLLAGVEAVLGTGAVLRRLDGWRKDNNGPDLAGLICGSEGTLGVVTAATLRVVPTRQGGALLGVRCGSWESLVGATLAARDAASAVEAVTEGALRLVREDGGRVPFADGHLLLVALDSTPDAADLVALLGTEDVVLAEEAGDRAALWSTRHAVAESVRRRGKPHKLDLSVPLGRMAAFLPEVEHLVRELRPTAVPVLFGHLADGNVHVNLLGVADDDTAIDDAVVALALEHGGHASAEHGIGVLKNRWLAQSRSPEELAVLAQLREVFDPDGVLNPRVLRATAATCAEPAPSAAGAAWRSPASR